MFQPWKSNYRFCDYSTVTDVAIIVRHADGTTSVAALGRPLPEHDGRWMAIHPRGIQMRLKPAMGREAL
jgi:hypothetical protein